MNNAVNVLRQSPIFNDLREGKAPDVPFVSKHVTYKRGYYLTDGIYPECSVLMKSISNPGRMITKNNKPEDSSISHKVQRLANYRFLKKQADLLLNADDLDAMWVCLKKIVLLMMPLVQRRDESGRIAILPFYLYVMRMVSLTQAKIDTSELDEDSDGFLQHHEMEAYIRGLIPNLAQLRDMPT
ncbi:probable serine/threonine-protein phosphatase 2A regulatory subunit B'' subunit TON2 [Tanacetum coccineum]